MILVISRCAKQYHTSHWEVVYLKYIFFSICVTVVVLNVHFRSPQTHKMAPWVKRVSWRHLNCATILVKAVMSVFINVISNTKNFSLSITRPAFTRLSFISTSHLKQLSGAEKLSWVMSHKINLHTNGKSSYCQSLLSTQCIALQQDQCRISTGKDKYDWEIVLDIFARQLFHIAYRVFITAN